MAPLESFTIGNLGIIAAGGLLNVAALVAIVREGEDTRPLAAARFEALLLV
ncbi:hypothetical protein [Mesorhizobium sp. M0088]|uniref:hypothetical protein n=1 Tax=Mesorhizobium sp. M0088 TaxID=2956873 RepID=UPI003338ECAC